MFLESFEVEFGAVPFVLAKFVTGVTYIHLYHDPVPGNFSNDTRGRNTEAFRIALDQRGLGNWKGIYGEAINEDIVRRFEQSSCRPAHRFVGGSEDVESVNFITFHDGDRPYDARVGEEFLVDRLALLVS